MIGEARLEVKTAKSARDAMEAEFPKFPKVMGATGKALSLAVRCDANPPSDMQVDVVTTQDDPVVYRLISLPLYLIWNLPAIIQER